MFRRSSPKISPDKTITRDHALECIPVRNPQITENKNDDNELCLTYQVRIRPWFQNIVQKITGRENDIIERKLQLDALGSSVWQMIDGKTKVIDIINNFKKTHQLNHREAEISVTAFCKELGKRGLSVIREREE